MSPERAVLVAKHEGIGEHMNRSMLNVARHLAAAMLVSLMFAPSTVFARSSPEGWAQPNESELTSHGHYRNKRGDEVHSPSKTKSGAVPTGASAKCADGTYSFSRHHSGTCSRHGGVATWE